MPLSDLARLVTLAALWGGSFAFIRVAAPVIGPLWLAESRVVLAFLILLGLALLRAGVPAWRERWRTSWSSASSIRRCRFALFCFAGQYIAASVAAILNATSPFFGAMVAAIWLKDPLPAAKVAACRSASPASCSWWVAPGAADRARAGRGARVSGRILELRDRKRLRQGAHDRRSQLLDRSVQPTRRGGGSRSHAAVRPDAGPDHGKPSPRAWPRWRSVRLPVAYLLYSD